MFRHLIDFLKAERPRTAVRQAGRGAARRPPSPCRPAVETLEDRCVPAVGVLDRSFSGDGRALTALLGPGDESQADGGVAIQADGKIVAVGHVTVSAPSHVRDFAAVRVIADGTLDGTFGNGGRVTVNFNPGADNTTQDLANAVAIQADGKIVLAGSTTQPGNDAFAAARLNPDGSLDTTFGTGGRVIVNLSAFGDEASGVALQADGKIVLAGTSDINNSSDFAVIRLNANGSPDGTFGLFGAGIKIHTFGGTDFGRAVALQADGKIVVAGFTDQVNPGGGAYDFAVLRLNSNGTEDGTFGPNGERKVSVGDDDEANAVVIQADGKIAVGGFILPSGDYALIRLNTDGTLDATFGTGGKRTKALSGQSSDLALQADGKILQSGFTSTPSKIDFAVIRYNANGTDDTTFGTNGLVTVDFNGRADGADGGVAIDAKGRIVLAGASRPDPFSIPDFAVARVIGQDQRITAGAFDPATGKWFLRNTDTGGPPDVAPFAFGAPGWLPVVGDWDGDGSVTVGVFDPATATFYLRNRNTPGPADYTFAFGPAGGVGIPVAGDWDGDGKWSVGVFAPGRGDWNLRNELSTGLPDAGSFLYGSPGSRPVVGDWDGDGVFSQGVVEPDGAWKLKNFHATGTPDFAFAYGAPGSQVVAGDWDGDGVWTPGVADGLAGALAWKLRNSLSGGAPDITTFAFGADAYRPIVGDWNFPALP